MVDKKKDHPSQTRNRERWILETLRENQPLVSELLIYVNSNNHLHNGVAKMLLNELHRTDRDALLQAGGIFTSEQLEKIS